MKKSMTRNQRRRQKLAEQRLIGIALLAIAGFLVWFSAKEGEDCTASVVLGAAGLFMLLNRKICVV